jgi:TatA/E family protein of Tat protein translocase
MNEWIIVGVVAIAVIFGATKLPEIARNLGRSSGEGRSGSAACRADRPPVDPGLTEPSGCQER